MPLIRIPQMTCDVYQITNMYIMAVAIEHQNITPYFLLTVSLTKTVEEKYNTK